MLPVPGGSAASGGDGMNALIITLLFVAQVPIGDVSPTLGMDMASGKVFCDLNADGMLDPGECVFGEEPPYAKLGKAIEEDMALHSFVLLALSMPGGGWTTWALVLSGGGLTQFLAGFLKKKYKARNGTGP